MFLEDRHQKILDLLQKKKSVQTTELTKLFGTSRQTIYNDIEQLNQEGKLIKVHGGAIEAKSSSEPELTMRKIQNKNAKKLIASTAAQMINDGDTIFLDIGTTVAQIIPFLSNVNRLTVVTNSIEIAYHLGLQEGKTIIVIGGVLRNKELSISGSDAYEFAKKYYVDKCFIGVGGLSKEAGYTDYHLEEASVRSMMIRNAKETYALMDTSKFNVIAIAKYAEIEDVEHIVSYDVNDEDMLKFLREHNIQLIDAKDNIQ